LPELKYYYDKNKNKVLPLATGNNLVEWAIASHGMYKSALIFLFISISKQKNLHIVGYVRCDNRIFPAARIKILP